MKNLLFTTLTFGSLSAQTEELSCAPEPDCSCYEVEDCCYEEENYCCGDQDYWCLDKVLSFRADYGYIQRQGIRNVRLIEDTSEFEKGRPKKRLGAKDLVNRFDWESAIRGGITYHGSECSSLEALYTYFYPWHARSRKTAEGTLQFPFIDPSITFDYVDADEAVAKYKSRLQNGELNYWGHVTPQRVNYFSFSWNLGFRTLFLKESFNLVFKKGDDASKYDLATRNNLYGLQLGAALEINPSCYWTWTFLVKGAGFLNTAKNDVDIRDVNNTVVLREYKKKRWTDTWLLEGSGELAFHWTSWLSLQVGYQGFFVTGLALAPEQRVTNIDQGRRIKTHGHIVIDGAYAGLTLSF